MNTRAVSIIVPIYNVEYYIEQCVVSLFEQDFDDIEYIFVNDCTPDKSVEILESVIERYPNRKPHCKVIHNSTNRGSGYTRKIGIQNATGQYTIQVDSDDWCELDMISSMYAKAQAEDLDVVFADMYFEYKNKTEYRKQEPCNDLLSETIIAKNISPSLCDKLIKKSIYYDNQIFPSEYVSMAEDREILIKIAYYVNKWGFINKAFYHYRGTNPNSQTTLRTYSSKEDLKIVIKNIEVFLKEKNFFEKYKNEFLELLIKEVYKFIYPDFKFIYDNYGNLITLKVLFNIESKDKTTLKKTLLIFKLIFNRRKRKEINKYLLYIKHKFF